MSVFGKLEPYLYKTTSINQYNFSLINSYEVLLYGCVV